MNKAKGNTAPEQKEATLLHISGKKLLKVYEILPEPTGLPGDAIVYDKVIAILYRYFAGDVNLADQGLALNKQEFRARYTYGIICL